jgi:hypothetical protein
MPFGNILLLLYTHWAKQLRMPIMPNSFPSHKPPLYGALSMLIALLLSGCVTPVGPTEVRRFHAIENAAAATSQRIAVVPSERFTGGDLEFRVYAQAVESALAAQGYTIVAASDFPDQLAMVDYSSQSRTVGNGRGPVSVGVGGGTGGFRTGLGGGIGLNLGGGSSERVFADMRITIEQVADRTRLWEGQASGEAKQGSPEAGTRAFAAKLVNAMFTNFPGESGESFEVK